MKLYNLLKFSTIPACKIIIFQVSVRDDIRKGIGQSSHHDIDNLQGYLWTPLEV